MTASDGWYYLTYPAWGAVLQPVAAVVGERWEPLVEPAALCYFCFGKTKEDRTTVVVLGAAAAVVAAAVADA